ncbi:MAG: hypothetical protein HY907_12855 [Deltaproteobacteria bacterium]|nr:hypothetical protein [Deltaproteobacteria bacterium]
MTAAPLAAHDPHVLWTFLDRAVEHFAAPEAGDLLARAEAEFRRRTGDFEPGQAWYEERIRLFHDWFLFDLVLPDGRVPLGRFLDERGAALSDEQREVYREVWRAGHRSLFEVDRPRGSRMRLLDRIGGATWELPGEAGLAGLAVCDLLDARLLVVGGEPMLGRGLLVHPRPAREAILDAVRRAREACGGAPWDLLDVLARMKAAWDRADVPRVPAIYGPGSYLFREFLRTCG